MKINRIRNIPILKKINLQNILQQGSMSNEPRSNELMNYHKMHDDKMTINQSQIITIYAAHKIQSQNFWQKQIFSDQHKHFQNIPNYSN